MSARTREEKLKRPSSSHYVEVRIDEDDLPIDNAFSLALQVSHTIPVLIIDGGVTEDIWESDGGTLAFALRAGGRLPDQLALRDLKLFTVRHFSLAEAEDLDLGDLEDFRAVVLANVPLAVPQPAVRARAIRREGRGAVHRTR